jgi:hypothetical protein
MGIEYWDFTVRKLSQYSLPNTHLLLSWAAAAALAKAFFSPKHFQASGVTVCSVCTPQLYGRKTFS